MSFGLADRSLAVAEAFRSAEFVECGGCEVAPVSRAAAATKRRISPDVSGAQQQGKVLQAAFDAQQKSSAWLRMQPGRQKLPALAARDTLLQSIAACDVTVVAGGTGCGKSTQVPQVTADTLSVHCIALGRH